MFWQADEELCYVRALIMIPALFEVPLFSFPDTHLCLELSPLLPQLEEGTGDSLAATIAGILGLFVLVT
jgi:hypothetical protein